jgi:hypothetical protein
VRGIENLVLAGDWVRTELSVGCVESAVQGARMAAQAMQRQTEAAASTRRHGP